MEGGKRSKGPKSRCTTTLEGKLSFFSLFILKFPTLETTYIFKDWKIKI